MYNRAYDDVEFEWDLEKAGRNRRKHGVAFADAVEVLYDEVALTIVDRYSDLEERFVTIGRDSRGRILVVVFTMRGVAVRLISARLERYSYEEGR